MDLLGRDIAGYGFSAGNEEMERNIRKKTTDR